MTDTRWDLDVFGIEFVLKKHQKLSDQIEISFHFSLLSLFSREFPTCEGRGESRFQQRSSVAGQAKPEPVSATPVKAWESTR